MGIIYPDHGTIGLELRTQSFVIIDLTAQGDDVQYADLDLNYDQLDDIEAAIKTAKENRRDK